MASKGIKIAAFLVSITLMAFVSGCNGGYFLATATLLGAPTDLSATGGTAQVSLAWAAPTGGSAPESYNIYYSTSSGVTPATGTKISGVTGTSYTQSSLTNGTTYYYVVTAVYGVGESAASNQASATPSVPVVIPAAPANLAATAGNAQVSLTWTASAGATSYNLYWSTTTGVTPVNGTKISNISSASYTQTGLTNGTTYYYVVTAVDSAGESSASAQASATPVAPVTAPVAPTSLSATAGNAQVSLTWAASSGASSYNLYWSTTAGVTPANGTKISGITSPSYVQTGLTNGTTYYYVVTAANSGGESPASNQASATPMAPVTVPLAPTNLAATAGNTQVSLTWTASAGAVSYNLYWSTTTGVTPANGTKISGIASPAYVHTGLTNGTPYYYVVTAVNSAGESGASNQATATPVAPIAAAPANLTATAGNAQVTLNWAASSGAVTYNLYWSTSTGVTPANGTKVGGISGTTYVQTGLTNGTAYYYVVTAVNTGGESPASNQATATPQGSAPAAPTLTATAGVDLVMLSWNSISGATSYNVYYSMSSGVTPSNGTKIGSIAGTSYSVPDLSACVPYYFVVTAVSGGVESPASNQTTATPTSATSVALTPGSTASVTLQAATNTSLTFNFPANAVSQPAVANLSPLTESQLPIPFSNSTGTFLGAYGLCFTPSSITSLSAPVNITGSVGSAVAAGTSVNLADDQNNMWQDVTTFSVGSAGALTESIPTVALPGVLNAGDYALYQPAQGTSTSELNLGVVVVADDGFTMANGPGPNGSGGTDGIQIIHIYKPDGTLLPTPTLAFLAFPNQVDLDGEALSPNGSEGILVDGSNQVLFYSGLLTGSPSASSNTLDITAYGGDGDSVAILPNGDEAVASGNGNVEVYITGILSGAPVIASTIPIPAAMGSDLDGLVISNDGKVMIGRGGIGITVWTIAPIAPTPGSLAGTVTHSFTNQGFFPSANATVTFPYLEDGRDGMAISPADSSRAVVVGESSTTGLGAIQMITGLPGAPVVGALIPLPASCQQAFAVDISPDGTLAAVGCNSGLLLYSGVNTGTLTQVGSLYAPSYTVGCQTFETNLCAGATGTVQFANGGAGFGVSNVAFTLDGKYLVALDGSNISLVVIPVSASGYGAPASALSNVVSPFNDQIVIH